jgi:hypothetical protein
VFVFVCRDIRNASCVAKAGVDQVACGATKEALETPYQTGVDQVLPSSDAFLFGFSFNPAFGDSGCVECVHVRVLLVRVSQHLLTLIILDMFEKNATLSAQKVEKISIRPESRIRTA